MVPLLQRRLAEVSASNLVLEQEVRLLREAAIVRKGRRYSPYSRSRGRKAVAVMTAGDSSIVNDTEGGSENGWSSGGWYPPVEQ